MGKNDDLNKLMEKSFRAVGSTMVGRATGKKVSRPKGGRRLKILKKKQGDMKEVEKI